MNKIHFIENWPDVCEQKITFECVLSRHDIEEKLLKMCEAMGTGLLGFEHYGVNAVAFTSQNFRGFLKSIKEGEILPFADGNEYEIVCKEPFMSGGEWCVDAEGDYGIGVYSCHNFKRPTNE